MKNSRVAISKLIIFSAKRCICRFVHSNLFKRSKTRIYVSAMCTFREKSNLRAAGRMKNDFHVCVWSEWHTVEFCNLRQRRVYLMRW